MTSSSDLSRLLEQPIATFVTEELATLKQGRWTDMGRRRVAGGQKSSTITLTGKGEKKHYIKVCKLDFG